MGKSVSFRYLLVTLALVLSACTDGFLPSQPDSTAGGASVTNPVAPLPPPEPPPPPQPPPPTSTGVAADLNVKYQKGMTYITWDEVSSAESYKLYRANRPINSVDGMTALVEVARGSSYDARYSRYHVIEDLGAPLAANTGLFVYRPKINESAYYAVTSVVAGVENKTVTLNSNSLSTAVNEVYMQWPLGILREKETTFTGVAFKFFYWMDYFNWPNSYNYYGEAYNISVKSEFLGKQNNPMVIELHGSNRSRSYSLPSVGFSNDGIKLNVLDYTVPDTFAEQTRWYGAHMQVGERAIQAGDTFVDFTSKRVVQYIYATMTDPQFGVDPNRIHLEGQSMGGGGTYLIGFHYPHLFASLEARIARINIEEGHYGNLLGTYAMNILTEFGLNVYKWSNTPWIADNMPELELPPVINLHGSQDSTCEMYSHTQMYLAMARGRRGIWGKWLNIGHTTGPWGDAIPGGRNRFLRNEMHPAFSNSNVDDDFGFILEYDQFSIPKKPADFSSSAEGIMNAYINWSSKLHDMDPTSTNDDLIDSGDQLKITLKSARPNTIVDITPRRLQNFITRPNTVYRWFNYNYVTGALVDSGTVRSDAYGVVTVESFRISTTGSQLVIRP